VLNSDAKKLEEKLVIDLFRKYYPDFPKGKLYKSESPDFILKTSPKRSVGLELTKCIIDPLSDTIEYVGHLEKIIEKKEAKIPLYQKKKLNELWLIITTDSMEKDEFNQLKDKVSMHEFRSGFGKVFLFEIFDRRIVELI